MSGCWAAAAAVAVAVALLLPSSSSLLFVWPVVQAQRGGLGIGGGGGGGGERRALEALASPRPAGCVGRTRRPGLGRGGRVGARRPPPPPLPTTTTTPTPTVPYITDEAQCIDSPENTAESPKPKAAQTPTSWSPPITITITITTIITHPRAWSTTVNESPKSLNARANTPTASAAMKHTPAARQASLMSSWRSYLHVVRRRRVATTAEFYSPKY